MPLHTLRFKPGINRESTSLANEGGWYECDKIRFRSGQPEKLGGWVPDTGILAPAPSPARTLAPTTGAFWGTARALRNWATLDGRNLLGIGTELKYYIQDSANGLIHDVTPLRLTTSAGAVTFAATAGSRDVVVTHTSHGALTGDFVTFSGAVSLGGAVLAPVLNAEFRITYLTANTYRITIDVSPTIADVGNGGSAVVGAYQVSTGGTTVSSGIGWGAGGWGGVTFGFPNSGWGSASTALTPLTQLRLWSHSNFGENLIINPRGGSMYYWIKNATPTTYDRALLLTPSATVGGVTIDSACPTLVNYALVSDNSRFVIAFGCNDPNDPIAPNTLDPMLIRWSDQESYAVWDPAITNQAGSFRLSIGSSIVAQQQTRQEILVWTDTALYGMQYLGPPYVWGVQPLASNISIMSTNVVVTANNLTMWMGTDKFYVYSGAVNTLPCTLWQYVFGDVNLDQADQFFGSTNERYNEVWWFYCSANSATIDRYVVFNYVENLWFYGTMTRTAWLDANLRRNPIAASYSGRLFYHEVGTDDGSTAPVSPINAYIQSSDFDIGDGHNYGFVWRIIPDITFNGSAATAPEVTFSARPRRNPGADYGTAASPEVVSADNYASQRNYVVQRFTQIVYTRIRGRQMALRIASDTLGTQWQLGAPRIDVRPDGRAG